MNTGTAVTIEAWVLIRTAPQSEIEIFRRYQSSAEHKALVVTRDGSIGFQYAGSPWGHGLRTQLGVFPFDSAWHHVAFVRHSDGRYFVARDGVPVLSAGPGPCWATCNIIHAQIPSDILTHDSGNLLVIDSIRVSTAARYSGQFTPSRHWMSDSATALLVQFDEGRGTTVGDDSPARQVGTISGEHAWLPLGAVAAFQTFGTGCLGSGGTPALDAAAGSQPRIGTTFTVSISGLPTGPGPAAIELGLSRTQFAGMTLPLEMSPWGMRGCYLYQSREITLGLLALSGRASWSVPVPGDNALAGGELHIQAWARDQGANPLGIVTTNGGTATLGF